MWSSAGGVGFGDDGMSVPDSSQLEGRKITLSLDEALLLLLDVELELETFDSVPLPPTLVSELSEPLLIFFVCS